ncbi:MAG: RidA family protein [Candidatus Brocadia sp.]|nr:RidA family protein [Candidatus Brocadia sp.]
MADITLADLDGMTIEAAHKLSFEDRNKLLDLIIKDALRNVGKQPERQIGLMSDYFEEDIVRFVKVRATQIRCGGFIPIDSTGEVPSLDQKEQFRLVFSNLKKALESMGSNLNRIVNMIIFLKNMDYWGDMNAVYREFIKSCPTRAAIGIQDLNKTYQIEIVNVIAYKVAK